MLSSLQKPSRLSSRSSSACSRKVRLSALSSPKSLALKQQSLLEDMMKSIREQLKDYNKDGRYKLILTKVGDNILYAEDALDITEDFIKYLNEHYNAGEGVQAKTDSTAKK